MAKRGKSYGSQPADDNFGEDNFDTPDTSADIDDRADPSSVVSEQPDESTSAYTVHTEGAIIDGVIYPIEGKDAPESVTVELTESRAAELQSAGVALSKQEESDDTDTAA